MFAILVWLGIGWQTLSPEIHQHIQAGTVAQQQGRLEDAIAAFQKVTELAPDLAPAFASLGNAYMKKGDYVAAIAPLKRALELNPELIGSQQMLGYALLAAGYASQAIPHLEKVQARDALGIAQLKAGRFHEAIGNLQAALEARPNDPDLLYYLGRASGLLSKQAFGLLQETQPGAARTRQVQGEMYSVLKNTAAAEQHYREALRIRPGLPGIHLELGELYAAAGQWDKAAAEYREEARLQPGDPEAAFRLGDALLTAGKVKEARAELERANGLAPGMPETLYGLGKAASLDGDKAAAEKAWLAVIAAEKDSDLAAQAHFGLAGLYRAQGATAKADASMKEFQRIRRAKPAERK